MRVPRFTPWLLLATLTAAGAAAALGYGLTAPKQYRATAQLLVAPVAADDSTFAGLDVLRDATGKPRAAQSAAVLVRSPQVADAVRTQLGLLRRSRAAVLADVQAHVVGASDVVDVTATDPSPAAAAQLANAFVDALIAARTTTFQSELGSAVRRDQQLLAAGSAGAQATELLRRLAVLRSLQGQPDPTVRRASTATAPGSASWPVLWALVLAGAGAGLAVGALTFLLAALLRRRGTDGTPEYSRGMSDRAVEAFVDRLEQRLAGRESALAARERDLQAKIDELRALEAALAERDAREAAPAPPQADERAEQREAELAERERALAERVAAVTKRELAVARAAAQRPAPAPAPSPEPEPPVPAPARDEVSQAPATIPAPAPAPAPREAVGGMFNLDVVERLVDERGGAFPDRLDEWRSTLFFLRDYADADGSLPGSFDWLVQDTFAPILG